MPDDPTPCPACAGPCLIVSSDEGTQSFEPLWQTTHPAARCTTCGGMDLEKEVQRRTNDGEGAMVSGVKWLLGRLNTERAGRQAAETERDRLQTALALAATHLDILTARLRGCNEETGRHVLLGEAEAFCVEAREALPGEGGDGDV